MNVTLTLTLTLTQTLTLYFTHSRKQYQGQQCVPVTNHKNKCEPQGVVKDLGLAPDFKCIKSRQALDQVITES